VTETFVSLFSGIGGGCLALEAFGYECVGQVEWDPYCQSQLERHWPDVLRWGNVASYPFGGRRYRREAAQAGNLLSNGADRTGGQDTSVSSRRAHIDVLLGGGFPCQPVSVAGRRKAQSDERWLWPEVARVVGELGPRLVVLENVRGLLSAGTPYGSAFAEVVGDLARLGYGSRWGVVRASDVGAPHQRARWFLVADREKVGWRPGDGEVQGPRRGPEPAGDPAVAWGVYEPAVRRWESLLRPVPAPLDDRRLSADFVEWMMGLPAGWTEGPRTERLKALGNSVVPQQMVLALDMLGFPRAE
jgi:DNA (cytosine-5)-methyltransferase 1